jgi:peptidoglycan-associated lipoprotein
MTPAGVRSKEPVMTSRSGFRPGLLIALIALSLAAGACHKKQPPIARPLPPPPPAPSEPGRPPAPPEPADTGRSTAVTPPAEDAIASGSLDDLNRNSPLKPVFYGLDSAEVDQSGQQALQGNADVLKKYTSWQVTIEGHCDERGTAEYNLALGERRATAARTYLLSLGVPADRIKVVSYGKEFPFDPGHDESAWSKNRRAHFVVTAK